MKVEEVFKDDLEIWTKPELKNEIKRLRALASIEIKAERDIKEIKKIAFGKTIIITFYDGKIVEYTYEILGAPKHITQESDTHWQIQSLTDKAKSYDIHIRKDKTYFCTCPSFMYNGANCKHIQEIVKYFGGSQ